MAGVSRGAGRPRRAVLTAVLVVLCAPFVLVGVADAQPNGVTGTLSILLAEGLGDHARVAVSPLDGSPPVPVDPASLPVGASSGDVVTVTGDPNRPRQVARVVDEAEPAATTGTRDLLLVPVSWTPAAPPPAPSTVNESLATMAAWYAAASHGRLTITTTVANPVVLPSRFDYCDAISQAEVASVVDPRVRAAGTDPNTFEDVIYLLPLEEGCGWLGMAEFGGPRVMMNGQLRSEILIHEVGHSLGLKHSDLLGCFDPNTNAYLSLAPLSERNDQCYSQVYGDDFSAMGLETSGSFAGVQLVELGWLDPSDVATATTAVTSVCLQPLASGEDGIALLAVPIDGAGTVYAENRRAVGVDAHIAENLVVGGRSWEGIQLRVVTGIVPSFVPGWVEPHRIAPNADGVLVSDYSYDLDDDIVVGTDKPFTWRDATGEVVLSVGNVQPSGCTPVTVTNSKLPAVPAAPLTVDAVAGPGQGSVGWAPPGSAARFPVSSYTATATPGGASCTTTTTSCTITGLTNGTSHTVTVTARNEIGAGPPSAASAPFVPSVGSRYHPIVPTRIQDSRPDSKVGGYATPWAGGQPRTVAVRGVAVPPNAVLVVPINADAVVANVTVTGTTSPSFLTVWPSGATMPLASSLVWRAGETVANAVTVKLGADGAVEVFVLSGSAHVIIDIVGYFTPNAGTGFTPLAPRRIADSRPDGPQVGAFATPWGPGAERSVKVTGSSSAADGVNVPTGAAAVLLNVTVTATTASSYLAAWPTGGSRPLSSSLGWAAGETRANAVTVKVGANGFVSLYNLTGNAHVVIDVVGYYRAGDGAGFFALDPVRVQDSRPDGPPMGVYPAPWFAGTARPLQAQFARRVRLSAVALALNVTVTGTSESSFLTVWPAGQARPLASSLNWRAGETRANAVTVASGIDRSGYDGSVFAYNLTGTVDVIADLAGYYA